MLGMDFLEDHNMTLNLGTRTWNYDGNPKQQYPFIAAERRGPPTPTKATVLGYVKEHSMPDMLSPLPEAPTKKWRLHEIELHERPRLRMNLLDFHSLWEEMDGKDGPVMQRLTPSTDMCSLDLTPEEGTNISVEQRNLLNKILQNYVTVCGS